MIGMPELLVILLVVLVVFGPSRIRQLRRAAGEMGERFRKATGDDRVLEQADAEDDEAGGKAGRDA